MKETGIVPSDINICKYLKKHAHQTNEVVYSCNLDASSNERDVEFGLNTLTFFDSENNQQNLQFKFKKLDSNNWVWTAYDDTEGNVATGTIKCDDDGNVIEGLYCVGNLGGGFYGGADYPFHQTGLSLGKCYTFGMIAARHALGDL